MMAASVNPAGMKSRATQRTSMRVLLGAFCEFYEEQIRYALRLIADGKNSTFLWNRWDKGTKSAFDASTL